MLTGFGGIYLFLVAIVAAVILFPSENMVLLFAVPPAVPALFEAKGTTSFQEAIYGGSPAASGHAVNAFPLAVVIVTALVLILWISKWRGLDKLLAAQ